MAPDTGALVGLALDAVVLLALSRWIKSLTRSADEIKKAPHYKPGPDLVQALRDADKGCIAYASVEGQVAALSQVLTSQHVEGKEAVIKEVTFYQHKSRRIDGTWSDFKELIRQNAESVPFYLRRWMGKGDDTKIHVSEPREASFIMGDLTTTYDHFTPNSTGIVWRSIDRLMGEMNKGVHETEKMLLTNTILLGIGEISVSDDKIVLQPPKSGARFILTTKSKAEVIKILDERSFWVKVLTGITGAIGLAIAVHLIRKYYKIWKQKREKVEFLNKMEWMREKREQRGAARAARDGRDDIENCCVVCLTNPREIVLLDCGHLCLCANCLAELPTPLMCPVCRQDVDRYVTTYNP